MIRSLLTACAILLTTLCFGQDRWLKTGRWLQRHDMDLSMGFMTGASYFAYNTKAIEPAFVTPELSLDFLLSQRVATNWWIQAAVVWSYKGTRESSYDDLSSPVRYLHDMMYGLYDLDFTVSSAHHSLAVPFKVQYYPGKLGLILGAAGKYFFGSSGISPYGFMDCLSGKFDAGALGGLIFPLGNLKLEAEYYLGFVNIRPPVTYVTQLDWPDVKTFNRSAQLIVRYTFHQLGRHYERRELSTVK